MDIFSPFWVSLLIFILTFAWIISERAHRSLSAFAGALVMVSVGHYTGFYTFPQVAEAVDNNTLLLLSGMMVIVAVMQKTGLFEYLAIKIAQKTHGSYWLLLISLGALTTILSMILDNVTTIILIAPVTLIITKILHFNPVPLLMSQAILSNIGGVGTLVGDPPNIIIGSVAGLSFITFLTHALPVVIVAWCIALGYMLVKCRKENKIKPKYIEKLMKLDAAESITKPIVLKKSLIVLSGVIILFFLHHLIHLPASFIALIGAAIILIVVAPHDNPQKYLKRLELSVLLFFISLFILIGGLEAAGVLAYIAELMSYGIQNNIVLTAIVLLWSAALLTAIIDNIPTTIAIVPIIAFFEAQGIYGVGILWWALVFGVGFGANITPIGSSANLVVMAKLEIAGKKIHNSDWMKVGVPVAFLGLSLASAILMLFAEYFM